MDLFGAYIEHDNKKINALNVFDYYTKLINERTFKNASSDRIVGEIKGTTKLIKETIIGFQNRCDINYNVSNPLFKVNEKYSNDLTNEDEGFNYKNVYATHIIGPLLIRNPYLTDYLLNKLCNNKKLKYTSKDQTSIKAYKKYLENFN